MEALEGYIRAFEVKKLKHVFNLLTLDLNAAARSFGLKEKPDVDIRMYFPKLSVSDGMYAPTKYWLEYAL